MSRPHSWAVLLPPLRLRAGLAAERVRGMQGSGVGVIEQRRMKICAPPSEPRGTEISECSASASSVQCSLFLPASTRTCVRSSTSGMRRDEIVGLTLFVQPFAQLHQAIVDTKITISESVICDKVFR